MALTEKEWAAIANKYKYGIDTDKAIKDELGEFIQIYIYETQDLTDTDLWVIFQEQFIKFTVESFRKIYTDIKSQLQKHLLKKGVYIGRYNSKITISKLLVKVI